MSKKSKLYQTVLREYEEIRMQKEHELTKRRNEIYHICPRIEEIEKEISLTSIRIARMVLQKPADSQLLLKQLQKEIAILKQEKINLLDELGFSENALQINYCCSDCKDTGYIDSVPCHCMKKKLIDFAYDQSNIKEIVKYENLDTFNLKKYDKKENKQEGWSPYENMQKIFNTCQNFCDNFDTTFKNLFLYGGTGLGKTFLCNGIAKELLDKGKTVLYMTAGQLFDTIEKQQFNNENPEEKEDIMEDLLTVDLLIIDDLGTEFSTILSSAKLFHIINTRMLTKKQIVISTNLAPDKLIDQYSDRLVSRIVGNYIILKFFGNDIRQKNQENSI